MKISQRIIREDGWDLKKWMKKYRFSFRQLQELTGVNFAYLHKVANGMVVSEKQAVKIRKNCEEYIEDLK